MSLTTAIAEALRAVFGKPNKNRYTAAIVLAGGSSTRMGEGVSKQQLLLRGVPVIVRTLLAFEGAEEIDEIVLVAKKDELSVYENYREQFGIAKLCRIVEGGDTRQASAARGFTAVSEKATFVAIHDGARCLVTSAEIDEVCRAAYRYGAATAAVPATETVKREKDGFIEETVDREHVYLARTPQVFGTNLYRAALAMAKKDNITVTDDCALVEHIEHPIRLVPCSADNIKITTPNDIFHATAILVEREDKEASL